MVDVKMIPPPHTPIQQYRVKARFLTFLSPDKTALRRIKKTTVQTVCKNLQQTTLEGKEIDCLLINDAPALVGH